MNTTSQILSRSSSGIPSLIDKSYKRNKQICSSRVSQIPQRLRLNSVCCSASSSSAISQFPPSNEEDCPTSAPKTDALPETAVPETATTAAEPKKVGLWGRVKLFFSGDKINKQKLAALGLGAVASYGFVSNITYGAGLAVAWITFVKTQSVSPLMPGQWKAFLAFYAGFWTVQNFVRPFRFSLALAMAPAFDWFIKVIQERMHLSRRNAFGVYLFLLGSATCIGVFGSIALYCGPLGFARF